MSIITISSIVLIILVIAFIGVGLWFRRMATSSEDFLLAGRKAPFWLLATAYLGGYVGGASVSGYVNLGFNNGISSMWASLFVVTGCAAFIIIFGRRLNYFGRKTGAVTLADFVCERFGEKLRLPIAIVGFMRPGFLTGMQFLAIAVVLKIVFGLQLEIGVVVSALIILLYLITAGQYSALITQWFQSILQSVGIMLFAYITWKMLGDPTLVTQTMYDILPENFVNMWSIDLSMFTVYFLTFGLFYLVDPWIYMWAYIGESPRVSSNGMLAVLGGSYYNVMPFLSGIVLLVGVTMGKLSIPEGMAGDGLYAWFTVNYSSKLIGVLILVGLLMTIISCGSSFAMNGVTILTRDIYQKSIRKNRPPSEKESLFASRMSLVVVVAIGIASALWLPILVPLWSLAQAIGISGLLATTLSAWFWKRSTTAGALASTVGGGVSAFGFAVYAWLNTGSPGGLVNGFHAAHIGLIVAIPLMIIVSLATKPEYEKAATTSYKTLGEEMMRSPLVKDKQTKPGFFGWLGAEKLSWKLFWTVVSIVFVLHYLLAFFFQIPSVGLAMVWVAIVVGIAMVFMLAVLGGKDIIVLVRNFNKSQQLSDK